MKGSRQRSYLRQSCLERARDRFMGWVWQTWDTQLVREMKFPDKSTMERGEWNHWVGDRGERLAARYLRTQACRILCHNYRAKGGGEVDIVCRDGNHLVFVEVKTRTSAEFGRPVQAVDEAKQRLIIRGANAWLRQLHFREIAFRFDVVEVVLQDGERPELTWLQEVFTTPQKGLTIQP